MERSRCLRRSRDAHLALFSLHRFASSQSRRFIQFVRPKNEGTHGNRKPTNARRHGLGGHRRQALTVLAVAQHGRCLGRCHAGPATHRPMPLMLRRPFMGSNHPTTPPIPIPHSVGGGGSHCIQPPHHPTHSRQRKRLRPCVGPCFGRCPSPVGPRRAA